MRLLFVATLAVAPAASAGDWVGALLEISSRGGFTISTEASQSSQGARGARNEDCGARDCPHGYVCQGFSGGRAWCVADAPRPPSQSRPGKCPPGKLCELSSRSGAPPPSSIEGQAFERYVGQSAVRLREELALGKGPVINAIARTQGVPAPTLGRTLRAHREELVALMGDGRTDDWAGRFLARVEELGLPPAPPSDHPA